MSEANHCLKTVRQSAQAEFEEKKSLFIGHVMRCDTEEEAQAFIKSIKKEYADATHNVSAYLMQGDIIARYSDDGEPQGTAGMPVLDVIRKSGVRNICVVVTRYFGGTLLGAGGLVRAYSHAAAIAIEADGRYRITTNCKEYFADGVILATGGERSVPKIPGADEFFGRGVSSCAVCDSFAARGRAAIVIGDGELALHEAEAILGVAESVTLCTNGAPCPAGGERFAVYTEPIAEIIGDTLVRGVRLAGGEVLPAAMVFLAVGVAGAGRLAATLGLPTEEGRIAVDKDMKTVLPRLYAAGDCTGGFLQIATAVGEGALAGARLAAELKK